MLPENVIVGSTDRAVTPPVAISSGTKYSEEEKSGTAKKAVCKGGSKGHGVTKVAAGACGGGG